MNDNFPRALIFGAGNMGRNILSAVQTRYNVVGFLDNDSAKWGSEISGVPIYDPKSILKSGELSYEVIVIASLAGVGSVLSQLKELGIERSNISTEWTDFPLRSRIVFIEKLAEVLRLQGITGCVAECGVFQGEFAKEINRVFYDKKFYLFDTFEGFDEQDVEIENTKDYSIARSGHLGITSEEFVMGQLPHPDKCIIKKGYFPESAMDVSMDEDFCFVNLDFDLYNPTLAGLEFFYPRMAKGGVILIHDYFSMGWRGVREAVEEFRSKTKGLAYYPIGDLLSVAIYCL